MSRQQECRIKSAEFLQPQTVRIVLGARSLAIVLHGESSKYLATPRNTKDKITYNQPNRPNRQTPQTKHKALPKGQRGKRITPNNTAAVHASAQQQPTMAIVGTQPWRLCSSPHMTGLWGESCMHHRIQAKAATGEPSRSSRPTDH